MATAQKIEAKTTVDCDPFYIESSLPNGVTIADYRRSRPPRPTFWHRLRALAA